MSRVDEMRERYRREGRVFPPQPWHLGRREYMAARRADDRERADTVGAGLGNCPHCGALIDVADVKPPRPAEGRKLCERCGGRGYRRAGDALTWCEDCRGGGIAVRERR
jgi:hypothetical protein